MKNAILLLFLILNGFTFSNEIIMSKELDLLIAEDFSENDNIILIDKPMYFSNNLVIPEYLTLIFTENGKLLIKEDQTITINGVIKAGKHQIFHFSKGDADWNDQKSNIIFTNQKVFKPEWWGMIPNQVPNNISQYGLSKQMMLDIKASNGGSIKFSEGTYYFRDLIIDFSNIHMYGKGDKTILKFDEKNFLFKSTTTSNGLNASTRQGALIVIRGSHATGNGNFSYNENNYEQIENIRVSNLKIEFTTAAAISDPTMNGLAIFNAKNVTINNVTVDLYNANRAFSIGTQQDNEQTENVVIKNATVHNSRTGVFITYGFPDVARKDFKTGKKISNILIKNNVFNTVNYDFDLLQESQLPESVWKYVDLIASGVYLKGNEYTKEVEKEGKLFYNELGNVNIENNTFNNADIGIRSSIPYELEKQNTYVLTVTNNTFLDFKYFGVFGAFSNATIKNNTFDSKLIMTPPQPSLKNTTTFFTNQNYCINIVNKIKNKTSLEKDHIEITENDIANFSGFDANIIDAEIINNNGAIAAL